MRQMINIDALAEANWAHADPQFHHENELDNQKEIARMNTMVYVEHLLQELLDSLDDEQIAVVKEHQDAMADTFADLIDAAR